MRKPRWILQEIENEPLVERLRHELNDLPVELARILALRGIGSFDEARCYFRGSLEELHDPFLMQGMSDAVARILRALDEKDRILVYGDYDVDGTTATALLTQFLRRLGGDVEFFVPNRFQHGYGLSKPGIDHCANEGARMIIALDCGISALDEAEYAKSLGIDLIICDHHKPHDFLPDAVAVLDPKRDDCSYPFKELCGCGVTFKLVQALLMALKRDLREAVQYLDLVALATASDVVPVLGENRILLREGLKVIRSEPRIGIKHLAREAHSRLSECTTGTIAYNIGPRINAAGRLGDAGRAVALLLAEDEIEASARARQLERLNQERRVLDRETMDQAVSLAERLLLASDRHTVVLHQPDWHIGVIGIVASRLVDRYYRPTIMMTSINGEVRGSARSINGINIFSALRECADLLSEFGGHDYAAGLSLPEENLSAFIDRFESVVAQQISPELLEPVMTVDAELNLSELNDRFWAVLRQFAPFGPENMEPVFHARNLEVTGEPVTVGHDQNHLKFNVKDRNFGGPSREVIGFRMSDYADIVSESRNSGVPLELLFCIQENTWNGRTTLQLRAVDLRLNED